MQEINNLLAELMKRPIVNDTDYRNEQGFLICGKCHTKCESVIEVDKDLDPRGFWIVPVPCRCRKEELDKKKADIEHMEKLDKISKIRADSGILNSSYREFTFKNDDKSNIKISGLCKKYVNEFEIMKKENTGIIFTGSIGSGKSFLACCIANALIEQCYSVKVTNFAEILNKMQGFDTDKEKYIANLMRYDLLLIDDLGIERDTAYSSEQIYNVIDSRMKSQKPTIVTTNLSIDELSNTNNRAQKRIYDRILEMCPITLVITGQSRRIENSEIKRNNARQILFNKG